MNATAVLLRLAAGGLLLALLVQAVTSPDLPRAAAGAALLIAAATIWRPFAGLLLTLPLSSAGILLAAQPARTAELCGFAFLMAWLLAVRRPLFDTPWPRAVLLPATIYGLVLLAAWLRLTLGGAAGVAVPALPSFVVHMIPASYLVMSSPEPETTALLQTLCGLGLFIAALGLASQAASRQRWVAWTVIATGTIVATATVGEVIRQWAAVGFEPWFVLRYVSGERFALHIADLNAAGSWFVIPVAAAAAIALFRAKHRVPLMASLTLMLAALWLIHSRTAYAGIAIGLAAAWVVQRRSPLARRHLAAAAAALAVVCVTAALLIDWNGDTPGSASLSVRLRTEFLATSARMLRSAPLLGVGPGRYFDRSAEFMSDELRDIYGNENAHNYVAQQFAEGGFVGGLLFLWLIGVVLVCGFRGPSGDNAERIGLFAAVAGYLSTCLTGHPLLVPEAALPFWVAAGVIAGGTSPSRPAARPLLMIGAAAAAVAAAGAAQAAVAAAQATEPPPGYGFHQPEIDDGLTFRWIDRHAIAYIPNGDGFVRFKVRAPEQAGDRPLLIETSIAGRVADRRPVPSDQWLTYDIPARPSAGHPFQRVDLRVNRWWTQEVTLGQRAARRPIAAKVAEIRWIPLEEAGR